MQNRIDQLEDLVKRLIAHQQQNQSQEAVESASWAKDAVSDASDSASSPGKTVIDGVHSVYKGADDWYDVLQEVSRFDFQFRSYWAILTNYRSDKRAQTSLESSSR